MSPMQPVHQKNTHNNDALAEFRLLCSKARKEGRQMPDQDALDTEFIRYESLPNPEFHRQLLRTKVMTMPQKKAPGSAAEQLAAELKDATGKDFSAEQVSLGSIFGAATRGR
jgi:hypothetical protein